MKKKGRQDAIDRRAAEALHKYWNGGDHRGRAATVFGQVVTYLTRRQSVG